MPIIHLVINFDCRYYVVMSSGPPIKRLRQTIRFTVGLQIVSVRFRPKSFNFFTAFCNLSVRLSTRLCKDFLADRNYVTVSLIVSVSPSVSPSVMFLVCDQTERDYRH